MNRNSVHSPIKQYILNHLNEKQPFGSIVVDLNKAVRRPRLTRKQVSRFIDIVAKKNNIKIEREGTSPVYHTYRT